MKFKKRRGTGAGMPFCRRCKFVRALTYGLRVCKGLQVWRRISMETMVELPLLLERWKFLLFGLLCQYLHGLAARGVHYLHRPGPILQDAGFMVIPELGKEKAYISETVFGIVFCTFILWTFHPFICHSKKFYTVLLWCRVLAFLVVSQFLRVVTFMSTQLPGPNYHCREGSKLARLPRPDSVLEVLLINFPRGAIYGCGDLIFSSHMIFTLVFVLTYQKYGTKRWIKQIAWLVAIILSFLIIASRKHYTVDVIVAWYTVNLVVYFVDRQFPEEGIDRSSPGSALPLISINCRDKDSRTKEEHHKIMNGNTGDSPERRQRSQVNGKLLDDGTPIVSEIIINGT